MTEPLTDREWAVEVDTALADLWDVESSMALPLKWARDAVMRAAGMSWEDEKPSRFDRRPLFKGSFAQAVQACAALAEQPPVDRPWEARDAKRALADFEAQQAKKDEVKAAQEPFEAEYRLARWNRAWLVLNNNGHVHSTRACGTCFVTTAFGWLPQLSGADEAFIVEQAGESACTVCYPSAPVASLSQPRRVFHKTEQEAQQAREARAAAKAEREAKKAAKTITAPDGAPLEVFEGRYTNHRTGQPYDRFETIATAAAAKVWLTNSQEAWRSRSQTPEAVQAVAEALAHKFGTTPEDEIAAAAKRAAKRK